MFKKNTALLIPLLFACSSSLFAAKFGATPEAHDDHGIMIVGVTITMTGNVLGNDSNGDFVDFTQMTGKYGYLNSVDSGGDYSYTLHSNVDVSSIPPGEVVKDIFPYTLSNQASPKTSNANLIIELSTVNIPKPVITSNVDIEFNDRSFQATPLNSGKNILGHLQTGSDKDWYSLASAGNEIITLEVCPQDSRCFGKKSWVLYVFDSDRLTGQIENQLFQFNRWVDETGQQLGAVGSSNHMYLAYRSGFFDNALIGVVDPCFDTNNTVNIGVGPGSRNYLIAISTPLQGSSDSGGAADTECGGGSVVLERPGLPVVLDVVDANGVTTAQNFATTEEFISIFPYSDDQYSITITGTGTEPLLSDEAAAKSATYNRDSGELNIPIIRVNEELIRARLNLQNAFARSNNGGLRFGVSEKATLSTEESDAYQATFNPANGNINIPRVTDTSTGSAYSVTLKYHSNDNVEVIDVKDITEK